MDDRDKPTRREVTTPERAARKAIDPFPSWVGKTLAERYKITQKLGEGGMGAVYLAEHVLIEKKVAIKILTTQRNDEYFARFVQEAKSASKIGHENIIDITDFGKTDDGNLFLVMEHLDGSDLGKKIRSEGPQPLQRCVRVINQVCSALEAAHKKGIVHRDLKPDNIFLVTRSGRPDFVKVLDFGLARVNDIPAGEKRLTASGTILGTPEYMAPEQVRGDVVDGRADVYSAGMVLYELLTGDVPFKGEPYTLVLANQIQTDPPPPSQLNSAITPELDAVVMKCLAKNPFERFQTMKDFALALCAATSTDPRKYWSDGKSIPPTRVVPPEKSSGASLTVPRSPAPRVAMALLALVTVAGLAWILVSRRSPPPRAAAVPAPVLQPPAPLVQPPAPLVQPPASLVQPPASPVVTKSHVAISSDPPDAEVKRGSEKLGKTPLELELSNDLAPFDVTLSHHGFQDTLVRIHPDRSRDYQVRLLGKNARPEPVKTPPATRPQAPPQKPNELKDVFEDN